MTRKGAGFADRTALFEAFRDHVNAGKIDLFRRYGFDAVMGRRAGIRFHEGRRLLVDRHTLVEEIVFDGYADGEIRFVRTVYRDGCAESETFGFDYPPRTGIPIYRIGDQAVEVTAVTAAEIEYRLQPL